MRQQWLRLWLGTALCTVLGCVTFGCGDGDTPPPPPADGGPEGGSRDGASDMTAGPGCGDGIMQRGELCDDGNTVGGDGCSGDCTSDETCGNGITDTDADEVCDDGNTDAGDGCAADCSTDYACGNGVVDTIALGGSVDEVCDDSNTLNGDGCDAACTSNESCGNGTTDLGAGEVCDDGNTTDGDLCSADCSVSLLCGNGTTDSGEECDDTNRVDGDGCNASCQIERCGNGRVDGAEACDDGNSDDADGCRADCTFTCASDANCADTDLCNGTETCTGGGTLASRCAAGTAPADGTACGSGLLCNGGACVAGACGDGFTSGAEQCDDGANANNNDGCRADCTFTCTTANAATTCGDGNTCTNETCTGTGTASRCSNPIRTGACTLAGGGAGTCNASGACVSSVSCGNGTREGAEACDDGNANNNDGCRADCTFTCTAANAATNCGDANACTTDTCTGTGAASRCGNPNATNGTSCGGANICVTGSCVAARCGDVIVTAPEQCDDGNTVAGDGCGNTCRFTCSTAANCADTNTCNGAETCTMAGTTGSRCNAGTALANGSACNDGSAATPRDICLASTCGGSRCGDGYIDSGATPAETCDDGNMASGDGCSSVCATEAATPPTGFRITNLDLISPRVVANVPIFGCRDITTTPILGFSVNGELDGAVTTDYSLHLVNLFRPYNTVAATTPLDLHLNGACMAAPTPDSCGPDATMPDIVSATANNQSAGTCFTPLASDVNGRRGAAVVTYTPTANTVSGPCFVTSETTLNVTVAGIVIPLQNARISATYSGTAPNRRLLSGVVTGFLSSTAAADVVLPASLPIVGGQRLYSLLQASGMATNDSSGTSRAAGCNVSGGVAENDRDMNGTAQGFWFFLNFTADEITWTGP